jgi:tetratricopeptide (TPR) repeat protein
MAVLDQSKSPPHPAPISSERALIALRLITKGDAFLKGGGHQNALSAYRHARDILDGLAVAHPDNVDVALAVSLVRRKIGDALRAQGNLDEARETYRASLSMAQALANSHPGDARLEQNQTEALAALMALGGHVAALEPHSASAEPLIRNPSPSRQEPPAQAAGGGLAERLRRSAQVAASEALENAKGRAIHHSPGSGSDFSEVMRAAERVRAELRKLDNPTGSLVENIPRKMRVGTLEQVEVRIARRDVEGLTERMIGHGRLHQHEVRVADAMTVRLRAPDGGFLIDPLSAETCWTHNADQDQDFANWRWSVTPQRRGQARLLLIISAQTLDANGVAAEAALPDQVIKVHVRVNYARTARKVAGWGLLMVAGGALSAWGRELYPAALDALARIWWTVAQ